LLLAYCTLTGMKMRFGVKEHMFMAFQGFFLFSFNYWFVYLAEEHLTSGLVAVIFASLVFLNMINGHFILGSPIRLPMIVGAVMGVIGLGLIFWPEISTLKLSEKSVQGLLLAFAGSYMSSLGNIMSARNQKVQIPIMQTNAFGMAYGALAVFLCCLVVGKDFGFDVSFRYMSSLLYLAIFGSIVAFGCYLTLLGRIGADKAAYATLLIPIVALIISTLFEGYQWSAHAFMGLGLVLTGNMMILKKRA
jgi:drug/metabolite transporter (DMT)-like permease